MGRIIYPGQNTGLHIASRKKLITLGRSAPKSADPMLHQACKAFRCGKPSRDEFCPAHWAKLPSELKYQWEKARDEAAKLKKPTSRYRTLFENVFKFLAQQDVAEDKARVAAEKAARQVEDSE